MTPEELAWCRTRLLGQEVEVSYGGLSETSTVKHVHVSVEHCSVMLNDGTGAYREFVYRGPYDVPGLQAFSASAQAALQADVTERAKSASLADLEGAEF